VFWKILSDRKAGQFASKRADERGNEEIDYHFTGGKEQPSAGTIGGASQYRLAYKKKHLTGPAKKKGAPVFSTECAWENRIYINEGKAPTLGIPGVQGGGKTRKGRI